MAYCGKCGTKNPDGAKFCGGCGAPLATTSNAAPAASQETQPEASRASAASQPGTMRMSMHRDGTPPPHREAMPPRRESALPQREQRPARRQPELHAKTQPDFFEPRKKKGGMLGGCMKRLGCGLLIFLIVIIGALWAIGTYFGDSDGDKGKLRGNDDVPYERIYSEEQLQSVIESKSFDAGNGEVTVKSGRYKGTAVGQSIDFDVTVEPDGKIAGKLVVYMGGDLIRSGVFAYCGNGVYSMYGGGSIYNNPDEYFQALPDHESIEYANGYRRISVKYVGPVPVKSEEE